MFTRSQTHKSFRDFAITITLNDNYGSQVHFDAHGEGEFSERALKIRRAGIRWTQDDGMIYIPWSQVRNIHTNDRDWQAHLDAIWSM